MNPLLTFLPRFTAFFAISALGAESGFTFNERPGESFDVLRGGRLVARYMTAHDAATKERRVETYKPFLHVFDAEGKEPITKGAGGDFTHHRGVFIGWNKITVNGNKYDRWHMPDGEQVHEKFLAAGSDKNPAFTSLVKWMGKGDEPAILEDERTFTFLSPPAGAYAVIDVISKVKALAGEVQLDGDPEHAGLQFRPANEVERKETVYFYPVENAQPHKDRDYPWFGETFTLRGKKYSVVYLNHPANPREGRISAYRDYGRFGVFWPTTIAAGATREFRARFIIAEGEMLSAEAIQKAWNEYAGAHDPTPKTTTKPAEFGASPDSKTKGDAKPATPAPKVGNPGPTGAPGAKGEPAAPATPKPAAHTADRGPDNPEIKFKLPPPPPLSPQDELKTFKLPPGFKAEIVASEPMIEAPIAASWDDQGRLYVCEMRGYMNDVDGFGEDQPTGRISRLEDTDGDGVYDKATVFVDKLLMPRAVMALGDGALVGEPPNLTWYRDTNGDGVADKQELVTDKFGTKGGQPEHMVNSPTWALDNWIACANHDTRYRFQNGKFTSEPVTGGGQWGLSQDDWGRLFFNYNSDLLRTHLLPPRFYARNPKLAARTALNFQTIKDQTCWPSHPTPGVNRGYTDAQLRADGTLKTVTATCGAGIYRGDLFGKEYAGNAFIPEPSGNLVKRLVLSESGGTITATNAYDGSDFLTSTDERFRPVNACTGPDGALYIVDMGRGVVQHKFFETHYLIANIKDRNLEQPLKVGRIWRIVPEGANPQAVKLPRESAAIVPLLAHANGWVRDTAQRVLSERGDASVVEAVKKLAADAATPQGRVHALWTLEGLGALTPEVVTARLGDADGKVRATAVRLADRTLVPELSKHLNDPSADVRLQLALNLSAQPGSEAALGSLLAQDANPFLAEAVATGLRGRELEFIETLLQQPAGEKDTVSATGIFPMLAGCVMSDRRSARVARLLELASAQAAGSPRQLALLEGMAGKSPAKGAPVKYLYLDAAPAALAKITEGATGAAKGLITRIDAQLAWPDKPGVPPPPVIIPLTAPEQALFEKGKTIYATLCAACHQPTGTGVEGLAPPLVDSEWVLGPVDRPARIVLHGLSGPVSVAGTMWRMEMPPLAVLSDADIAATLTYIRREWEHNASPVAPADVAKIRAAFSGRTNAWTADELLRAAAPKQGKSK